MFICIRIIKYYTTLHYFFFNQKNLNYLNESRARRQARAIIAIQTILYIQAFIAIKATLNTLRVDRATLLKAAN
jgi:hypothetical protein